MNQLCSICLTKSKQYKAIDNKTVCNECYNDLFRLSKSKKKSIDSIYNKYKTTIKKLRFYELKEKRESGGYRKEERIIKY